MINQEIDTPLTLGRRLRLVRELASGGKFSAEILKAIGTVPRHIFVEKGLRNFAYENTPVAIGACQTISQPSTVALETQLLELTPGAKVLEIGTGSGYQSAILHFLGAKVYTIERHEELFLQARKNLDAIGYGDVCTVWGDGFAGLPQEAPFDGIIVTCGAPEMPRALLMQLRRGGRMVIPIDVAEEKGPYGKVERVQQLFVIVREEENKFVRRRYEEVKFVPMLRGITEIK